MPYRWTPSHSAPLPAHARTDGPAVLRLDLWPHRSLPSKGFSATIWGMFSLGLIPVIPFIGTAVFWVLLGAMMLMLAGLWTALRLSDRDKLREELLFWPDRMELTHWSAKGKRLDWQANPYWVQIAVHKTKPVENYLTLSGGRDAHQRTVELGSFLSADERAQLRDDLAYVLGQFNAQPR